MNLSEQALTCMYILKKGVKVKRRIEKMPVYIQRWREENWRDMLVRRLVVNSWMLVFHFDIITQFINIGGDKKNYRDGAETIIQ